MKAMILAAGLGKRMRPLTDTLPKPLLPVAGKPLIHHHLLKLKAAGVDEVIINISYLGHLICEALGDGSRFGLQIHYSEEPEPLETGGAIRKALPLLGDEPFLLVNGDVWVQCDFAPLLNRCLPEHNLGHLLLVPNPEHCASGNFSPTQAAADPCHFALSPVRDQVESYTFSGISVLRPQLVSDFPECREYFPLREAFSWAMQEQRLSGEVYSGQWVDVGTPERLAELERVLVCR